MGAVGRELQRRKHRVTVFQSPALRARVENEGLEFVPIGTAESIDERLKEMSTRRGTPYLEYIRYGIELVDLVCGNLPRALVSAGVQALIADQVVPGAGTVARALRLPFMNVCHAIPLNADANHPPHFLPWAYLPSFAGRLRNRAGYALRNVAGLPVCSALNRYRRMWGLPRCWKPEDEFSPQAQTSLLVPELDFPRAAPLTILHYVGPYHGLPRHDTSFPFEKLDKRPLVYASLGTLADGDQGIWRAIVDACATLDVQLVLSLGGRREFSSSAVNARSAIIVPFAPQTELLKRAAVMLTHAGLNSVLEALTLGVPLVCIPITHDQPGVAMRVLYKGAGTCVPLRAAHRVLRAAIHSVLRGDSYRPAAEALAAPLRSGPGEKRVADIAEALLQ